MAHDLKQLRDDAVKKAKGPFKLAAALDITPSAISQWLRIPHERVLAVSEVTDIPCHELRPDLYPQPEEPNNG